MTIVRGKAPLKVSGYSEVSANSYGQEVTIRASGCDGSQKQFKIEGTLSIYCAKNLIRELRKSLHTIRDETARRLAKAVTDAEGPL